MFRSVALRILRSKRIVWAVFGNGSVSLANFMLSVGIARESTIEEFGRFSIAMVSYLFLSGLTNAALTNISLVKPESLDTYSRNLSRLSISALAGSFLLVILGLILDNMFVILLGIALHGLLLSNYQRTFASAAGDGSRSFFYTLFWSVPTIVFAAGSIFLSFDPVLIFAVWALFGSLSGYLPVFLEKKSIFSRWSKSRADTQHTFIFAFDFLVGQGGAILTTGFLGFLDNARILGAVRGAGTLLGPVNLLSTTARSLLLPFLARENERPKEQIRSAVGATLVQACVILPVLGLLQFIPDFIGHGLLGETWAIAGLVIFPISVDAFLALIASTAIAGHRVALAGKRTLLLRLIIGLSRPVLVVSAAHQWGALGAAWAMALIALINAIAWWISYYDLVRRAEKSRIAR